MVQVGWREMDDRKEGKKGRDQRREREAVRAAKGTKEEYVE